MADRSKADQLIMFICASRRDLLRCWKTYGGDSFRILLFADCGANLTVNGVPMEPREKSVLFLRDTDECEFPVDDERYREEQGVEYYAIYVGRQHYASVKRLLGNVSGFESFENDTAPRLFELDDVRCDKLIRELKDFNQTDDIVFSEHLNSTKLLVASLFYTFIVDGNRPTVKFTDAPKWFGEYYELIEHPENFTKSFDEIVALSGKTREHLSRVFKSVTGTNISEHIISLRINYACMLLKGMRLPLAEIVHRCGFTNIGTFYSNFKKITGESPEHYRKVAVTGESFASKKK